MFFTIFYLLQFSYVPVATALQIKHRMSELVSSRISFLGRSEFG
jgi:hypothetical protein